ncbi:peptidase inhibitor family I36 protein [Streptomyces sp. NPDC056479]|uniref:peptidase inhibitor family I36 protein n=1 Tax=Streptomyces sp. NPDC056479 TaxID=3345832 RepID=UPI00367FB0AC
MSKMKRYASLAAAAVAVLSVGFAGPASAETTRTQAAFGEQARAAGLSRDDAKALQTKVDRYLARHDGRQVAANEIVLAEGATLTVTVPGEKYVRELSTSAGSRAAAAQWECADEYFCMYRQQLGMGDRLALYYCQDYALQDWTGEGSYYNLQTRGTQALLKNQNRTVIHVTPGAPYGNPSYDWTPVWYVRPC